MISSRTFLSFGLMMILAFNVGCANVWHNLKPHRIQRLNRGPAPSLDPEFSHLKRDRGTRLANSTPITTPKMSANSAEITVIRAQSSDENFGKD